MLHTIRASREITGLAKFAILGYQAVLGHFLAKNEDWEFEFNESAEIDIALIPENEIAENMLAANLGEASPFHREFHIFVDGISLDGPIFPKNWSERLLVLEIEGGTVYFPSLGDIASVKYIAYREKDLRFVKKMWQEGFIESKKLLSLLNEFPEDRIEPAVLKMVKNRIIADAAKYS